MANEPNHDMQCRQVAALVASGATQEAIRQQLGISRGQVAKLINDPSTRQYVSEMGEEVTKAALIRIKQDMAKMTGLALKALEANLRKNNMEAVKTLLRVAGALDQENSTPHDTTLTVIMPGAKVEKVVELDNELSVNTSPTTDPITD